MHKETNDDYYLQLQQWNVVDWLKKAVTSSRFKTLLTNTVFSLHILIDFGYKWTQNNNISKNAL